MAPKGMSAPRRFMFDFCGRRKVAGGGNNRLLRDESYESSFTEQVVLYPV